MAKSLTIKNKNNEILYPKTVSSLVYDNTTGNTVKLDIDILKGQVAELSGVDNAFFGGVVETSNAIVTDYSTNGYSGVYLYMVGSDMSSLVAYQYNGSGSPIQLFEGSTYDFTDYTEVKDELNQLKLELYNIKNETKFLSKLSFAANISNSKITAVAGYSVFYAPVKSGDIIKIQSTNDTNKNITTGFTSELPADGVAVTSITSQSTASFDKTLTATLDGYVVIASYSTYHTDKEVSIEECISTQGLTVDFEQGTIVASSGQIMYCIPAKAGNKFHITATNPSNYFFRYGFTVTRPVENTQVLSAQGASTDNVNLNITAILDGYLVISHSATTFGDMEVSVYVPKLDKIESNIELFNDISFVKLKYTIVPYKKITQNGEVVDAASENNRTLVADVSNYAGKTLYLDGVLYAASNTYCWYSFLDSDGQLVSKSNISDGTSRYYSKEPVIVPEGAATIYVQGSISTTYPSAKIKVNDAVENLKEDVLSFGTTVRTFKLDFSCLQGSTGKLNTGTNADNKYNKHTPDFIRIHKTIRIKNLEGTKSVSTHFYDKDLEFISYTGYINDNGWDYVNVTDIPVNAVWFRISFYLNNANVGTQTGYERLEVDIESEWGDGIETSKEPYREYQAFFYPVKVNMPMKIDNNPSIVTKTIFAYDEGLIHLPSTYTPNGKPTPLIFFIHGDAERYTAGESSFSGHMKMQQCWSDAGFAQVDLDLIPSCYNEPTLASTGGTRDDLECLSAAWNWIITHYNIDTTGFYLIGRSRGGQAVFEILGKGGAVKLPIIAAISMAGANSIFEYSVYSLANENEWQLWCNAHGLPTTGRPTWGRTDTTKSFLSKTECYNFVVDNWNLWWRKALTGWGLVTKNSNNITPRNYFDNYIYPYIQNNQTYTAAIEEFFVQMLNTMEAKSPIPLRLDWCVGDQTQTNEYFVSPHSYSSVFAEILLNTPASLTEYRRWDSVDASNPYDETNPHFAENMIFYNGDLTLPNGVVTSNPSKVTMEWLIWCMGKDPRYQGINYTLPW